MTDSRRDTRLVHTGRHPEDHNGVVNPPVYRVSTVLSATVAELEAKNASRPNDGVRYGRYGTPTTYAFEEAMAEVEQGHRAIVTGSGLAATTGALTALLSAGDHMLLTDSAYYPTRAFCDKALKRMGVETTYYDPMIGADIASLIRANTKVVFVESPGSQTFEVQDIPAIAQAAHAAGALVVMDNTWGILSFRPFEKGVDVSIQACTKYVAGHSDAMLGAIITKDEQLYDLIRTSCNLYGYTCGSEEAWLGLRGIRTLAIRLKQQFAAGLEIANWLAARPEVARVRHPALPSCPGHDIWKRDFDGGCGLFAIELKATCSKASVDAMLDGYDLFAMGYSWGGYESLVIPAGTPPRTAKPVNLEGPMLRYHVGLEDIADLIADLERGFDRLNATA